MIFFFGNTLLFSSQSATDVLRRPDAGFQVKITSRQKQALGAAFVTSGLAGDNTCVPSVPRPVPTAHARPLQGMRHGYKAKLISCSGWGQGIRRLHTHCSPTAHLGTSSPPVPLMLVVNSILGKMYMHFTRHNQLFTHCPKTFLGNFLGSTSTAGRIISEFWGARILPSVLSGLGSWPVLIWSSCHPQLCPAPLPNFRT